jgi:hypothetical protein
MRPSVARHATRAGRRSARWASAGVGYAVAYYLDAEHGEARRQQAVTFVRHLTDERRRRRTAARRLDPPTPVRSERSAA